jgi:hypothetical protein
MHITSLLCAQHKQKQRMETMVVHHPLGEGWAQIYNDTIGLSKLRAPNEKQPASLWSGLSGAALSGFAWIQYITQAIADVVDGQLSV